MAKAAIKAKSKLEAKGIDRMKARAEARKNVKYEVKRNGEGDMKTIGLSAAEGKKRARERAEAKMRGACDGGYRKREGKGGG